MTTQQIDRRSGAETRKRLDLNVNLSVSRREAMNAAQRADELRDTTLLMYLHEAVAALDKAIEVNDA